MSIVIAFFVGVVVGVLAAFFVGRNNQEKIQAAYAKSLAAQAAIQKELEALKAKV